MEGLDTERAPIVAQSAAASRVPDDVTRLVNTGTQRDTDFVRKAPRRFFVGLYMAAVALFASWGFYLYMPGSPDNNSTPWPLALCMPLAKMFGRVLTLTLCLLMLTAMRSTTKWLRTLPLFRFVLPLDALIPDFHRALAFTAAAATVGHITFHAIDFAFLGGTELLPWSGGFCVTFDGGPAPTLCLLYSGSAAALLLAIIVVISLIYTARVRRMSAAGRSAPPPTAATPLVGAGNVGGTRARNHFATVQLWFTVVAHWILVPLFIVAVSIHAQSKGYSYVAIPFWVLGVALLVDVRMRYRGTTTPVIHRHAAPDPDLEATKPKEFYASSRSLVTTIHANNIVQLVVAKPPGFSFKAGQSALLHVDFNRTTLPDADKPWLHRWQYHPFTIACSPAAAEESGRLVFLIRDQNNDGSWTTALRKVATQLDRVDLAGPNGAPYEYYDGFETVLLVGTGAGVTPLASIFASMANDEILARQDRARGRRTLSSLTATAVAAPQLNHPSINHGHGDGADDHDDLDLDLGGDSAAAIPAMGARDARPGDAIIDVDDRDDAGFRRQFGSRAVDAASVDSESGSASGSSSASSASSRGGGNATSLVSRAAALAVSPRLLIFACVVVLAATLAIGVYVIIDSPSIAYDWVMILVQLAMTAGFLVPLFGVRLYLLLTRATNPMPAEWVLELLLLILAVGGAGIAAWGVRILATTDTTDGNIIYWFLWLLLSVQGALTILLVLARSLVFIFYRAPFAADRISGRAISFEHRTVQFLAFVDRPMQAGLQALLERHTDAMRASGVHREQFSVDLCASKGLEPIEPDSSLAVYVQTSTKAAAEVANDDYEARFLALLDGRLQDAHKRRHKRMNFIGVFFCGNAKLSADLYAAVLRAEALHTSRYGCNCYVSFHEERFF